MTVKEIYNLILDLGIKADPRGKDRVNFLLKKQKEVFENLKEQDKKFFDSEKLANPYSDTRILTGPKDRKVKRVLVGIDMETAEVLLAEKLQEKGKKIDLIIAHHPEGMALAALDEVMELQNDILSEMGVPINVAESLMEKRMAEVKRTFSPLNHARCVDSARILGYPLMTAHTPSDNLAYQFLVNFFKKNQVETVGELLARLKEIPEYEEAAKFNAGPMIFIGHPNRRVGKILFDMTGGTEGSKEIYERLSHAGIGTIVGMHISEQHKEEAEKHHLNIIIAGHIASDSLGMNQLLDELEHREVEIIPCSGLIRVKRKK